MNQPCPAGMAWAYSASHAMMVSKMLSESSKTPSPFAVYARSRMVYVNRAKRRKS